MDNELESQNEDPVARMIATVALGHAIAAHAGFRAFEMYFAQPGTDFDKKKFDAMYQESYSKTIDAVRQMNPVLAEMLSDDADPLASLWD